MFMAMDAQTGFTLFNAIASAGKAIFEIAQGTLKLEEKQQLMEVYDALMTLKRAAADLEDENHSLKQRLRFNNDEFDFRSPFWYGKNFPNRALCAKCFANEKASPMGDPYKGAAGIWRRCLVCDNPVEVERGTSHKPGPYGGSGGPDTWMER
jgi:hypothetical protein